MAIVKLCVYCTFPKEQIQQPILYNLGRQFQVIPNIRGASISDDKGLVFLELEGEEEEVQRAVDFLKERRVQVDEVTDDGPPATMH